tara:strand:- start:429 stop:629 length:201 start_codon:yes stop_codon:yes gene_type:complete
MNSENPSGNSPKKDNDKFVHEYIASLSPLAKKGLEIAQSHLESSFSLKKSIGFLEFVKSKNTDDNS